MATYASPSCQRDWREVWRQRGPWLEWKLNVKWKENEEGIQSRTVSLSEVLVVELRWRDAASLRPEGGVLNHAAHRSDSPPPSSVIPGALRPRQDTYGVVGYSVNVKHLVNDTCISVASDDGA